MRPNNSIAQMSDLVEAMTQVACKLNELRVTNGLS
jgi:hypothetical protein